MTSVFDFARTLLSIEPDPHSYFYPVCGNTTQLAEVLRTAPFAYMRHVASH
jgi:hypothetical protein